MKICKECGGIAEWNSYYGGITCTRCGYVEKPKPTNYDMLLRKSPEEMACMLSMPCPPHLLRKVSCPGGCETCWLDWLNAEANEREFSS